MTIAHRLSTIADYDRVLVFEKGELLQNDEPIKLLVKNFNDITITQEGMFADMVRNTGKESALEIFDLARNTYLTKSDITSI